MPPAAAASRPAQGNQPAAPRTTGAARTPGPAGSEVHERILRLVQELQAELEESKKREQQIAGT
jgi:hypothetical protein